MSSQFDNLISFIVHQGRVSLSRKVFGGGTALSVDCSKRSTIAETGRVTCLCKTNCLCPCQMGKSPAGKHETIIVKKKLHSFKNSCQHAEGRARRGRAKTAGVMKVQQCRESGQEALQLQ